jgi:hypothetical protein
VTRIRKFYEIDRQVITCPTLTVAENLSDLIDGYCRLVNNSNTSIWTRKGKTGATIISLMFRP